MALAAYFWRGDLWGLGTLVLALLGMGVLQAGLAMVVMFAMNKLIPDKLLEKNYGDFDFENFQKVPFQNFLFRMLIIFAGATLVLHLAEYLVVYREIIRHWGLWSLLLFVLETSAIAGGLYFMFKLDRLRLAIITAASALTYVLLFALLRWSKLMI